MSEKNREKNKGKRGKVRRQSSKRQSATPGKKRKQLEMTKKEQINADFAACGRCSFFWAGYRIIVGEEMVETAVQDANSDWMPLIWNQEVQKLVHKSYGSRIDTTFYHFAGRCQECQRAYVCQVAENEAVEFRMQVTSPA